MEVLEFSQVMQIGWWVFVAAIVMIISGCLSIIAASNSAYIFSAILGILCLISLIVLIATPTYAPTNKMSYTIEITNPAYYKTLVEKGYSFTRLFENKEIYTIIGDVLQ